MIKKLRKKFIVVSMCAVTAVLAVVMILAYTVSYANLNQSFDQKLSMLANNNGRFPILDMEGKPDGPASGGLTGGGPEWPDMSPESPYETRYFTVGLDDTGKVLYTDTGFIAAIESEDAAGFAQEVYKTGKSKGYIGDYRYLKVEKGEEFLVVFLDCGRDLDSHRSFVWIAIMVSVVSLLAVLVLLSLLSKYAIAPLAESYAKQKQFITDASHELKTPLTIISANNEVIELENGSSQWTESIRNQVERLSVLTGNLVALARMDEDGMRLELKDFSLSNAVVQVAEAFAVPAENKEIKYSISVEKEITLHGNEDSIRQLVSLLCDNAVKYANQGGEITIFLKRFGKKRWLSVANTVKEIEKGKQEHLFERFYRADSSRNSNTGGNGIGLSLAKAIVEAHKGKISAVSEDGKSLMITVIL